MQQATRPVPYKIFLISISLLLATNSFAQKRNVVKANVLSPLAWTINVSYERVTKIPTDSSRVESLQVTGFYHNNTDERPRVLGYGYVVEYRWYEKKSKYSTQPRGTYLSAYARYEHFSRDYSGFNNNETDYFKAGGVGGLFGEQWVLASVIVIDSFVGLGYDVRSNKHWLGRSRDLDVPNWDRMYNNRLAFRFGVRVGIRF